MVGNIAIKDKDFLGGRNKKSKIVELVKSDPRQDFNYKNACMLGLKTRAR
jgi:hypothetical protein